MVPQQESRLGPLCLQRNQMIDNLRRLRSTIDKIAQEDQFASGAAARRLVGAYLREEAPKQIKMAMNVADGVKPASFRSAHGSRRGLCKSGKQSFEHQRMLHLDGS